MSKFLSLLVTFLCIVGMLLIGYVALGFDVLNGTSETMNVELAAIGLIMMCSGLMIGLVSALCYENVFNFE